MAKKQRSKGQGTLFKREPKGPWVARWFNHARKRKEASTRTTDKATAERLLQKHVAAVALRRDGIINPEQDSCISEAQKPLAVHFVEYDEHLRVHINRKTGFPASAKHRRNRRDQLNRVAADLEWVKLADLDRAQLERWLADHDTEDMGTGTRNRYTVSWSAFANWCVDTHRIVANPFTRLAKGNEKADRKQRRALNETDLARLIDAAQRRPLAEYGRKPVKVEPTAGDKPKRANWTYEPVTPENIDECEQAARKRLADKPERVAQLEETGQFRALVYKTLTLTGLRLNELRSLTVGQTVLDGGEPYAKLAAADEKARRGAEIALRGDLAKDLSRHLTERLNVAQRAAVRERRPVLARLPDNENLLAVPVDMIRILERDLIAAGLAHRVRVGDKWRIDKADERGRVFCIHAFRTTFNSLLAAAGVPLTTRRILMRHAAEGVTDEHYADAKLIDLRGALDLLPALPLRGDVHAERQEATGTDGREKHPRLYPQQLRRETERTRAASRGNANTGERLNVSRNALDQTELSEAARHTEELCGKAGDEVRTRNIQLGRLKSQLHKGLKRQQLTKRGAAA